MQPVSLGESAESAVESIGSDSECGSLVVALRVERRRLEAILSRSIEQLATLELASILLKKASEGDHLLLSELFGVREHAVELCPLFSLFPFLLLKPLLLFPFLLLKSLLLLFFFLHLSFFGFLLLPLFLGLLLSLLDDLIFKDLQPSLKVSAMRCQLS